MTKLYDSLPFVNTGELLRDSTDWRTYKLKSEAISKAFNSARGQRIYECGSYLQFAVAASGEKRLMSANFCKDRMCFGCQKRRSLIIFHQLKSICCAISADNPTYKYLLLTLTVPNVKSSDLSSEIKHLHKSWDRLSRRAFFKKSIKGWFRALEVTYNARRDDYHPHLHILLCVTSGYFKNNYITRDSWLEAWQQATRYPHITQVDIRAVKPNPRHSKASSVESAVAEVAKYATKPKNYLCKGPDNQYFAHYKVVRELSAGIAYKRMIAYGGLLKEYHLKLRQQDVESDQVDLVHIDSDNKLVNAVMIQVFRWDVGFRDYVN